MTEAEMKTIIFLVEKDRPYGYTARALDESIFTEAKDMGTLIANIREAVECHYKLREGTVDGKSE